MKSFKYILVLFFAYFVCVVNVFATVDGNSMWCGDIVYNTTSTTYQNCSFYGLVFSNQNYRGYGDSGISEYTTSFSIDYAYGTHVTNYDLFGSYSSTNSLIPYTRPPSADDWSVNNGLYYYHAHQSYTDSNGYVSFYEIFEDTDYIDFLFPYKSNWTGSTIRLDFAIHINLTSIPNDYRRYILSNLWFEAVMPNNTASYCSSIYNNSDIFRVSCSADFEGKPLTVRLKNIFPKDFIINNTVNSYTYKGYFDISNYIVVVSNVGSIESLQTDDSPNGSIFDDDYNILESNSTNYFHNFNISNYNGLTNILLSPLNFLRSINVETSQPLVFKVFNVPISLPSGYTLFWGRSWNSFQDKSLSSCNSTCRRILWSNFKALWNTLFGGWIIYLSIRSLVLSIYKCLKPTDDSVEVF